MFFKIYAYEIFPVLGRFRSKRLKFLEWEEYFSADEIVFYRSEALKAWEKILPAFPPKPWHIAYDNRSIDFSKKVKQDLGQSFEYLFLFKEIQKKRSNNPNIYVIESLDFAYLSRIIPAELFSCKTAAFPSKLNVFCDILSSYFNLVRKFLSLARFTGKIYLSKNPSHKEPIIPVRYLWDAVNPNELSISPAKRYFPWIADGNRISIKDVIFLIPNGEERVMREIEASPYQAFNMENLYRIIPKKLLLSHLRHLLIFIPKMAVPAVFRYEHLIKSHYMTKVLTYKPLIEYLKPCCFVTSLSSIGSENPAIEYMNCKGIKTILYCYGGTIYSFVQDTYPTDFRNITYANMISSQIIVWNEMFKNAIEEYPQSNLHIKVIGPLMPGDEKVFNNIDRLKENYMPGEDCNRNQMKYISFFDVSAATKQWNIENRSNSIFPLAHTEEYCTAFIRDMLKLLEDMDNIILLFKPLRSLTKKKFSYSPEFRDAVEKIRKNKRGVILDDDVNPWVPIAISDMCIGIPFTSAIMAAMHYGRTSIYHDPTGIVVQHRYQEISANVTHGYEQLKHKVEKFLVTDIAPFSFSYPGLLIDKKFVGQSAGINSSDEFRKYLNCLSSN